MKCIQCGKQMEDKTFVAPKLGGKEEYLTFLECGNRHEYMFDWQKMRIVELRRI